MIKILNIIGWVVLYAILLVLFLGCALFAVYVTIGSMP